MIWDSNKVIIIIIMPIVLAVAVYSLNLVPHNTEILYQWIFKISSTFFLKVGLSTSLDMIFLIVKFCKVIVEVQEQNFVNSTMNIIFRSWFDF